MPKEDLEGNKPQNVSDADAEQMQTVAECRWLSETCRHTPARIFTGRAGSGYSTLTQLELRRDHATALDAVHAELDLERDLGEDLTATWNLFTVQSEADSKTRYLMRPDLGRKLNESGKAEVQRRCPRNVDVQFVIGDGLSAAAVVTQIPRLLPPLIEGARNRGWQVGQPFVIRYCRVGIMNDVGELLNPSVVVLLIGERPGLATAQSLSAYFSYQPRAGHTDANRNLISNIHDRGLAAEDAVRRILDFVNRLKTGRQSGFLVREGD